MNDELKNNSGDVVFGDEPAKKEIAVAGQTSVTRAGIEDK